jgi:menaquinol-cytochrome c reductase iron-sulfur subunit
MNFQPEKMEDQLAESMDRRTFLNRLSFGLTALTGALLAIPVVGALIAPLFRNVPRIWRPVGAVNKFKIGDTVLVKFEDSSPLPWAGVTAETAAWLRRHSETEFTAFAVNCAHLGCPVRWIQDSELFLCPCHGGVYYKDGSVAAGPPPRGLSRYPVRVKNDRVEILTSPIPITNI